MVSTMLPGTGTGTDGEDAARGDGPGSAELVPLHTAVRGRARFRVPRLHHDGRVADEIEARLVRTGAIRRVEANPLTGTVLVQFDSNHPLEEIVALLEQELEAALRTTPGGVERAARPKTVAAPARADAALPAIPWHTLAADAVVDALHTSRVAGLTPTEGTRRLRENGPNCLPQPDGRSTFAMLADQFMSAPVGLLAASAALSVATGGVLDAALIGGVLLANGLIGFFTERHADRTISALGTTTVQAAAVVRDGERLEIPVEDVVAGDVVMLSPGSYVPADVRIVESRHLTIDESTLTGESMPVSKSADALHLTETPLADRTNMAYMGTLVTGGSARGVVVATGPRTELGTIHALVGTARAPETPMQRHLDDMGTQLALVGTGVCAAVFGMGVFHGAGLLEMLLVSTSLAVAAIPEGLPTVATTTLALGIRDMRRGRVLIRRLDAVENLGAIQVLCLDKTGTLTRNQMAVTAVHAGGTDFEIGPEGVWRASGRVTAPDVAHLRRLLEVAVLCNESEVEHDDGRVVVSGSPTENALIDLAVGTGVDVNALRGRYPLSDVRYRTEKYRFMATLHQAGRGGLLAIKGSPAEVLGMCRWCADDAGRHELDDVRRTEILRANERMAAQALRVLGLAYAERESVADADPTGLVWLGLVGMTDPLRPGMRELIAQFHRAGIETVMITGDQSATAYAVGRQLALSNGQPLEILDSESLERLDPQLLSGLAERVRVFARVSPAHKLQIVRALQDAGKVVAMTGDGVNDAPALRAADIGVVVGDVGTELARSVADVVVDSDDLKSMLVGVRHGRTVRDNVRKSLRFLVATNLSEVELVFGAVALGAGAPLGAMQLLWINLVTDVLPGIALALEPSQPDVMERPPRNPDDPILAASDWRRIGVESATMAGGALASYSYGLARYGAGAQASTCAFMTLTLTQLLNAISCRTPDHRLIDRPPPSSNPYLTAGLGLCAGLQLLAAFFPPLRGLLGLAPIGGMDAIAVAATAAAPFLVNEMTKPSAPARDAGVDVPVALGVPT